MFLVQNDIKYSFLLTSQRRQKFLGNIWSRSHPLQTIAFHTSFLALSSGFWHSCNSAAIISIKAALKDLNRVFHPRRRPFFTETAYKLWRSLANDECRLRQLRSDHARLAQAFFRIFCLSGGLPTSRETFHPARLCRELSAPSTPMMKWLSHSSLA